MRIIICGVGAVGLYLAKMLSQYDHDIIVVDKDQDRLDLAESHYDLMIVNGDSTLISTLEEAQASRADLLISVTSEQNINILSCIVGKELGVKTTIARIDAAEYLLPKEQEIYKKIGVDTMIYPERIAGLEIVELLSETAATEAFKFSQGRLTLLMIKIGNNAPLLNKTLGDLSEMNASLDFRAVAIKRGTDTIMPTGNDVIKPNDNVFVITKKEGTKKLLSISGNKAFHIDNIMILGGTKIGMRTALELEKQYHVKLIERNKEICHSLVNTLNDTLIICGTGNDVEMLEDEGIRDMDAFISVTNNSEANIFACLLAKKMGVKKTIALVDNIEYIEMSQNIGIDTIINKKLIAASYIHQYTMDAEISSSKCLSGVDADVLEFVVKPKSKITKREIKDLHFPKGAIIGGIVRGDESIIAVGDTKIEPDDHVVVFALPHIIPKVEKFFH